jgi:hypothetical protein
MQAFIFSCDDVQTLEGVQIMLQTFRGIIEQDGRLRASERINLSRPRQGHRDFL